MKIFRTLLLLNLFVISISGNAQNVNGSNDPLHTHGKIYVVVGVLVIIFAGLMFYLWRIEKKLNKMENKLDQNNKADGNS